MNKLLEFSHSKEDFISDYGGSDRKTAIIYNGDKYMLKYTTKRASINDIDTSYVNNVLSEYVGSHVFATTGLPVHETYLGLYNGEFVVACKNFLRRNEVAHEFAWYMRQIYDSSELGRIPVLGQIYRTIEEKMQMNREAAVSRYWDTFVVDALIGNFDRHKGNWSYVVDIETGQTGLAPVYDCGSTLFPNLSEEGMRAVLESKEEVMKRVFLFPKAALQIKEGVGKKELKISYYDMLSSGYDPHCTAALFRMRPRIDLKQIKAVIDETPCISDTRKEFYFTMIAERKVWIIDRAYEIVQRKGYDEETRKRIETGYCYSETDFQRDFAGWKSRNIQERI